MTAARLSVPSEALAGPETPPRPWTSPALLQPWPDAAADAHEIRDATGRPVFHRNWREAASAISYVVRLVNRAAILAALPNREDAPEPLTAADGRHPDHACGQVPCPHLPALVREDAPSREGLDVERLMDAEHRWCVQVEGEWALRHPVESHRRQAEFVRAALAVTPPGDREDGLDVERLYRAMVSLDGDDPGVFNIVAISEPDTKPVAAALAAEYTRLEAAVATAEAAAGEEGS